MSIFKRLWRLAVETFLTLRSALTYPFERNLLRVDCAPRYNRRTDDLSVNICGKAHRLTAVRARLNGESWEKVPQELPRSPRSYFAFEILPERLSRGTNQVEFSATGPFWRAHHVSLTFEYDDKPDCLPLREDWSTGRLDVQDGLWEIVERSACRKVRPIPGEEHYDRILNVSGSFSGPRRVETDIVFRQAFGRPYGFGILHLWGGHPETEAHRPRRGWLYAIAWYMSLYGVGIEVSRKLGPTPRSDALAYHSFDITPNAKYRVIVECWPELSDGQHQVYRHRMKWWQDGQPEPASWVESHNALLPSREYSVALMAHWCQVEFGEVSILRLKSRTAVELEP